MIRGYPAASKPTSDGSILGEASRGRLAATGCRACRRRALPCRRDAHRPPHRGLRRAPPPRSRRTRGAETARTRAPASEFRVYRCFQHQPRPRTALACSTNRARFQRLPRAPTAPTRTYNSANRATYSAYRAAYSTTAPPTAYSRTSTSRASRTGSPHRGRRSLVTARSCASIHPYRPFRLSR